MGNIFRPIDQCTQWYTGNTENLSDPAICEQQGI